MGPILGQSSCEDEDGMSTVFDPADYIDMHTILRSKSFGDPSGHETNTLGRKNEVVRFSNSRASAIGRNDSIDHSHPRSFLHDENVHFYYD